MKKLFLLLSLSLGSAFANNQEALPETIPPVLESYQDFHLLDFYEQKRKSEQLLEKSYQTKWETYEEKITYYRDGTTQSHYKRREVATEKIDEEKVKKALQEAKQCDADALTQLGYLNYKKTYNQEYDEGNFSYETARKFFELAAKQGHPLAESRLGEMYIFGLGGNKQDFEKAKYWLKRASNHGYKYANLILANLEMTDLPNLFIDRENNLLLETSKFKNSRNLTGLLRNTSNGAMPHNGFFSVSLITNKTVKQHKNFDKFCFYLIKSDSPLLDSFLEKDVPECKSFGFVFNKQSLKSVSKKSKPKKCPKIDWKPKWKEKIAPKSEGKNEGWETVEKPVFTKWKEKIAPKSEGESEGWPTVEKPVFTK